MDHHKALRALGFALGPASAGVVDSQALGHEFGPWILGVSSELQADIFFDLSRIHHCHKPASECRRKSATIAFAAFSLSPQ